MIFLLSNTLRVRFMSWKYLIMCAWGKRKNNASSLELNQFTSLHYPQASCVQANRYNLSIIRIESVIA